MTEPVADLLISQLSASDRLELISRLWDSIPETSQVDDIPDWHCEELQRRLEAADADPNAAIPWEQVRYDLRKRSSTSSCRRERDRRAAEVSGNRTVAARAAVNHPGIPPKSCGRLAALLQRPVRPPRAPPPREWRAISFSSKRRPRRDTTERSSCWPESARRPARRTPGWCASWQTRAAQSSTNRSAGSRTRRRESRRRPRPGSPPPTDR